MWKLRRTKQCAKCPWRVDVDPTTIPDGYSVDLHRSLERTIAEPGAISTSGIAMACHESNVGKEMHCIGWLNHQRGDGNNIALRLSLATCENIGDVEVFGEQHNRFEDTLPEQELMDF